MPCKNRCYKYFIPSTNTNLLDWVWILFSNIVTWLESIFKLLKKILPLQREHAFKSTSWMWIYYMHKYVHIYVVMSKVLNIYYNRYIGQKTSIANIIIGKISRIFSKYQISIADHNYICPPILNKYK